MELYKLYTLCINLLGLRKTLTNSFKEILTFIYYLYIGFKLVFKESYIYHILIFVSQCHRNILELWMDFIEGFYEYIMCNDGDK